MAVIDLHCRDCGHRFQVIARSAVKQKQKRCPKCRSTNVRQSFGSFLRNGTLSSPSCGAARRSSGFG